MFERELRHYLIRLRHSQRLRYRMARMVVAWLPVVAFLLAVIVVLGAHE